MVQSVRFVIALLLCMQVFIVDAAAEETGGEASRVALGASGLQLTVPDTWKGADQRSRIIEHEFSAPADAKEGDKTARITMMQAGGSIDAISTDGSVNLCSRMGNQPRSGPNKRSLSRRGRRCTGSTSLEHLKSLWEEVHLRRAESLSVRIIACWGQLSISTADSISSK